MPDDERRSESGLRHRAMLGRFYYVELPTSQLANSTDLKHFVWESSLRDWCQFNGVQVPDSNLEEAVVIIEILLAGEPECEHGGALVEGKLCCGVFEGEAEENLGPRGAFLFRQLQKFLKGKSQIDTRWRLCGLGFRFLSFWPFGPSFPFFFCLSGLPRGVPPYKLPKTARFLIKFNQILSAQFVVVVEREPLSFDTYPYLIF